MAETWDDDAPVYVAVGTDVEESRLTLLWPLRNLHVKKLYLLHVHQPTPMTPSSSGLEESEIHEIQQLELDSVYESFHRYCVICEDEGVSERDIDVSCISKDDVGEGIVELIYDNDIKKLVMGAAADCHYFEGMGHIRSRKAKYVRELVPHHCKIWFICNGNLIQSREGQLDRAYSSDSLSESSDSVSSCSQTDSAWALVPVDSRSPGHGTDRAIDFERLYNEEMRLRREIEEALETEREIHEKTKQERDEAISSAHNTQILYDQEVRIRRDVAEELEKAKEENERMKTVMEERERNDPPSYFYCPITKDIMHDPHVAADGYTYEADAFKEWLSHRGETSPITNLRLRHHNLTPNLTLRSAIHEWLQQHPYFADAP